MSIDSGSEVHPRVGIVTGGASGIGLAATTRLARDGWSVAVFDLNGGTSENASHTYFRQVDVRDRNALDQAVQAVEEDVGPIGLLVNSAGLNLLSPLESLAWDEWQHVINVNLHGTFNCIQAVGPLLLERRYGAIVNIASIAAERGAAGRASYCVSKAGVVALTRVAAAEWAGRGVRVNAVGPGFTETPLLRAAMDSGLVDQLRVQQRTPAGRLGRPSEIAAVVSFLASDDASYVNGQTVFVDGGFLVDYGVDVRWTSPKQQS